MTPAVGRMDARPVEAAVIGAVLGVLYLTALQFFTQTKASDALSFVLLLAGLPMATAAIVAWLPALPRRSLLLGKFFVATVAAAVVLLTVLHLTGRIARVSHHPAGIVPLALGLAATVAFALYAGRASIVRSASRQRRIELGTERFLLLVLLLLLVLFSPYDPAAIMPSAMIGYVLSSKLFVLWLVPGLVFALAVLWLYRHEALLFLRHRSLINALALAAAIVFVLSLYDDSHFVDLGHYAPYVGPALQAHAGGVPMVDVYSVYGFAPWALIWAAYKVLPATIGTAAIVVRTVTLAYYTVFVVFVFVLARRRVSALIVFVPCLMAAIVIMPGLYAVPDMFNVNGTPSGTGMRFLPAAAMALLLAFDIRNRWVRRLAYGLLAIASLWSLETFAYTGLIWGGVVVLEAVRERDMRNALLQIAGAAVSVAAAHLLFVGIVYATTGRVVDYKSYFDLMLIFSSVKENQVPALGSWSIQVDYHYLWWIPFALVIVLSIALATASALRGEPRGVTGRAVAMALFGICTATYFMGRSTPTTLGFSILPFACLAILAFEPLAVRSRRFGFSGAAASVFFTLVIVLTFAYAFERFARPVAPVFGNSTILRHCFSSDGCAPAKIAARIAAATRDDVEKPYLDMFDAAYRSGTRNRIAELSMLLRQYAGNQARVAVLPDVTLDFFAGYVALSKSGQWYKWPIGAAIIEQQSTVNTERIVTASTLRPGELLMVGKPNLLLLEQRIFDKLRTDCRLISVEETAFHAVYRAETCADASGPEPNDSR
jgi:hypothetical protein